MSKIAIDIDNTICNTSDFFGPIAEKYDRTILHKNNAINYDKIVFRSDNWWKDYAIRNCEEAVEKTKIKVIMIETNKTKDYNNDKIFKTSNWKEIYNYITK